MGKGDLRTRRGKIWRGTHGKTRLGKNENKKKGEKNKVAKNKVEKKDEKSKVEKKDEKPVEAAPAARPAS